MLKASEDGRLALEVDALKRDMAKIKIDGGGGGGGGGGGEFARAAMKEAVVATAASATAAGVDASMQALLPLLVRSLTGDESDMQKFADLARGRVPLDKAPAIVCDAGVKALPVVSLNHRFGGTLYSDLKAIAKKMAAAVHSALPGSSSDAPPTPTYVRTVNLPHNLNCQYLLLLLHLAGFTQVSGGIVSIYYPAAYTNTTQTGEIVLKGSVEQFAALVAGSTGMPVSRVIFEGGAEFNQQTALEGVGKPFLEGFTAECSGGGDGEGGGGDVAMDGVQHSVRKLRELAYGFSTSVDPPSAVLSNVKMATGMATGVPVLVRIVTNNIRSRANNKLCQVRFAVQVREPEASFGDTTTSFVNKYTYSAGFEMESDFRKHA